MEKKARKLIIFNSYIFYFVRTWKRDQGDNFQWFMVLFLNNSYNLLNFVEIGDLVVLLLWDFVSWNNIWNGNQSVLLCFKLFFKISWRISLLFGFWLSHSIHLASSWLFMWCLCPCFCFRQNVAKTFMCFPSQATMYLIPDIYFTSCTNSNTLSFLKKKM